jgi:2-amino-4-hydroxy-6-hydroxymethyldihydropteridine diphosphokinase
VTEARSAARAFIGLGSNLGDPTAQIARALGELDSIQATRLLQCSSLYRSAPWGVVDQPAFVNAVAEVETRLSPRALLDALLSIEQAHGRDRGGERWGPRTLDLDLLAYADLRIDEPGLVVPHPRLAQRAFVLMPLADIAADLMVAGEDRVRELLARVEHGGCERIAGSPLERTRPRAE